MKLPIEIEEIIIAMTGLNDPSEMASVRRDLQRLGDGFARIAPAENRHLKAYLAYHFPANLMKTLAVMREIDAAHKDLLSGRRSYHVLDIGCGSGAGMFGFFLARHKNIPAQFDLQGIDSSAGALEQCRNIIRRLEARYSDLSVKLTQRQLDPQAQRLFTGTYDAILCVNSLVEIFPEGPLDIKLLTGWLRRLSPGGMLVIIEPALKTSSRRLMALRPDLARVPGIRIIRPCLHAGPCPLLAIETRDEWCHETIPWKPPGYMVQLNRGLEREIDVLKFSYLVMARIDEAAAAGAFRVISRRLKEKGKTKCFLCTPEGRIELYRLDKDRSETNAAFDDIQKGDVISADDIERRGRLFKVHKHSRVIVKNKAFHDDRPF